MRKSLEYLGLSEGEVRKRIEKYGYNEVREEEKNPVMEFLSRYWGPMPWLLELAIALSILLGHFLEAIIIFTLLTVNGNDKLPAFKTCTDGFRILEKRLTTKVK